MVKNTTEVSNMKTISYKLADFNDVLLKNQEELFTDKTTALSVSDNTNSDNAETIEVSNNDSYIDTEISTESPENIEEISYEAPVAVEATSTDLGYKAVYSMEATAYTGGELTASGTVPVRDANGLSTIAVDPSIIPLGSKVYIPGYGMAIASDTGGAINGNIVDLYLNSYDECIQWGRQGITLYVLAYPGEW